MCWYLRAFAVVCLAWCVPCLARCWLPCHHLRLKADRDQPPRPTNQSYRQTFGPTTTKSPSQTNLPTIIQHISLGLLGHVWTCSPLSVVGWWPDGCLSSLVAGLGRVWNVFVNAMAVSIQHISHATGSRLKQHIIYPNSNSQMTMTAWRTPCIGCHPCTCPTRTACLFVHVSVVWF